jgi:hypothetical protein
MGWGAGVSSCSFLYLECSETHAAFPPFLFLKAREYGQHNATDCRHRPHSASWWWRVVRTGTLVLNHSIGARLMQVPLFASLAFFQLAIGEGI